MGSGRDVGRLPKTNATAVLGLSADGYGSTGLPNLARTSRSALHTGLEPRGSGAQQEDLSHQYWHDGWKSEDLPGRLQDALRASVRKLTCTIGPECFTS